MYGITLCRICRRPYILDESKSTSSCPYCNKKCRTKDMIFYFESVDQNIVRSRLQKATGPYDIDPKNKKKSISKDDFYSTMIFRFEHCSDLYEKMCILANGLTYVQGTFTFEDIKKIVGKNAEKMLFAMLNQCIIFEVSDGIYKS